MSDKMIQMWQGMIRIWHEQVFGAEPMKNGAKVYSMRVLEESLELAQAEGVSAEIALQIVKQVYDKPAGVAAKELGGVIITMIGYANQSGLYIGDVFNTEYARINEPNLIEKIRFRNFHGDKIGLRPQDQA